jgi:hypothetical protein
MLLLLLTLPAVVQAQFNYIITNGTVTITRYTGLGSAVTIPSAIEGLPVTTIGRMAFYSIGVTTVTIPNTVTNIGSIAFYGCNRLTAIDIPNGVTSIEDQTFEYCTSLTNITIPSNVTSIGDDAFASCSRLASITIPSSVTSIGVAAFAECSSLTSVTIPSNVTSIGDVAFEDCTGLTNAIIGNSVSYIGDGAFVYCRCLASVTIGNSVTYIGDRAFYECTSLTSAAIPNSVTRIGYETFAVCGLTNITIPNSLTNVPDYAFAWCDNLASITIPNSIMSIGVAAFTSCAVTNITIPSSVTSIGQGAFSDCSRLTSITIPSSVTMIASGAFGRCTSLTTVMLPNNVTSIGAVAFANCTSLTNFTVPSSVISIGDHAFASCTGLNGVYFQGNAPSLGLNPFDGDSHCTIYYFAWTMGWGPTFGGRPTSLLVVPPAIQTPPQTQTTEAGSEVELRVEAHASPLPAYQWFFNGTPRLNWTNSVLQLAGVQYSQAGVYTVVVTNTAGSATSPPALLSVIPMVERKRVPGINVMGEAGSTYHLDCAEALGPSVDWFNLGKVTLAEASQFYFDLTSPLPHQRFYRAWQSGAGAPPALNLHFVPSLTLAGTIGSSVRVDYIDQFGPIDAWVTLATVTLTNTTQLYFDTSVIGQAARLWRIVPVP